ncbi:hypothetical protein DFH06DRAFT_1468558 [Mycena polygramma]|nr:hypothetical protein DFH06DRAFT_1468558 [Mycena polygramma]
MADPVTIIIDDKNFESMDIGATGVVDSSQFMGPAGPGPSLYNGSMFIPLGSNGAIWEWALLFEGISVSLVGVTPPDWYNQTIGLAYIANDPDHVVSADQIRPYTYPSAAAGGQFYTSGTLPASGHMFLVLSNASGISIDYALVTAGDSTSLQGQTIIVDDASPEISWNGNWTAHDNLTVLVEYLVPAPVVFAQGPPPPDGGQLDDFANIANVSSHANTTHESSTVGDSFTFQFAGTSLSIFGFTPGGTASDWLLEIDFTLDGNATTKVFTYSNDPLATVKPNVVYFNAALDAATGNHTLVAKIVDVAGNPPPAAIIDYITYRPSFATIADKPKFLVPASNATGAASSTSSGTALSSASSTATVPAIIGGPVKHRTPVGAIVGGVLGGCLLIAMLAGTFYLVRRRRARERDEFAPEPFDSSATPEMRERNGRSKREPLAVDSNALAERRNDLAAEIQHLQESRHDEEDEQTMDERMRALQAQMDTLTHHLVPPSYVTA